MKRLSAVVAALLLSATTALAVPNTMNYQGQLFLNNTPTTGPVSIIFRMFDASTGGTQLWTETDNVTVTGGLFSTTLGDGTTFPGTLFSAQVPWLEMEVNGTVLTPRKQFQSVPYAFNAPGTGGNELWSTDGTNAWRPSGRVGIGVNAPGSVLDILSTTGDHNVNAIHYSAINPSLRLDASASGNHQSALMFLKNGASRWSLLNDVLGDDSQTIGFKDWVAGTTPFVINQLGNVGVGATNPVAKVDIRTKDSEEPLQWHVDSGPFTGAYVRFINNNARGGIAMGSPNPWGNEPADDAALLQTTGGWQWNKQLNIMGNVGIANNNPQARLDIGVNSGYELQFSGTGSSNIFTPSGDMFLNTGAGWSLILGANGVSQQLVLGANLATINTNTQINGSLNVSGQKCRVVHDAKYGDLYFHANESANALFSLEGESKLKDGTCVLELDPKWLAGVKIDEAHPMQVWITFYGSHGDYYIERTNTSFKLIDPSNSNATFGWKVEARQKGYEDLYLNVPTTGK